MLPVKPKSQWVDNSSSNHCSVCDNEIKPSLFSTNKHHCRYCGLIVCYDCSQQKINSLRACNQCYEQFYHPSINTGRTHITNPIVTEVEPEYMINYKQAQILNSQKKFEEAYHEMLQSLTTNDSDKLPERVRVFADILVSLHKWEELETLGLKTLEKDAKDTFYHEIHALSLLRLGKYTESLDAWQTLLVINPLYECGNLPETLMRSGKTSEGLIYSKKLITKYPQHITFNFQHGLLLSDCNQFEEACKHFKIGCSNPEQSVVDEYFQEQYYDCLVNAKKYREAMTLTLELLDRYKQKLKYRLQYAKDLNHLKRYDESINEYLQCLDIDSSNVTAFCRLIWIYINQKRFDEAKQCCKKMLETLPNNSSAFAMNGHLTFQMKEYEQCKEFRQKAMQLSPDYLNNTWNYLDVLFAMAEMDEAKIICDKIVATYPESEKAHMYCWTVYSHFFEMECANTHSNKVMSLNSNNVYCYYDQCLVLFEMNQLKMEKELLEKQLMKKRETCLLRLYGIILREEGDMKQSEQFFAEAIELYPHENSQESFRLKGHLHFVKKEFEESCQYFRKAIDLYFANPYLHYWLGVSLVGMNELTEAEKTFKTALQIRPTYPRCHHDLGLLLIQKLFKMEEGLKHLKKANEIDPNNQKYILSLECIALVHQKTNGNNDNGNVQLVLDTDGENSDINLVDRGNIKLVTDTYGNDTEYKDSNNEEKEISTDNIENCKKEFERLLSAAVPNGVSKYLKKFIENDMNDIRYVDCEVLDDDILLNIIGMKIIDKKLFVKQMIKHEQNCEAFEALLNQIAMNDKYQTVFKNNGILSLWSFHHIIKTKYDLNNIIQNQSDDDLIWNSIRNIQQIEGKHE
eukprot:444803_1